MIINPHTTLAALTPTHNLGHSHSHTLTPTYLLMAMDMKEQVLSKLCRMELGPFTSSSGTEARSELKRNVVHISVSHSVRYTISK